MTLCHGVKNVTIGIIPLMAVIQPTKNKIRRVLNFRELNKYVTWVVIQLMCTMKLCMNGGE